MGPASRVAAASTLVVALAGAGSAVLISAPECEGGACGGIRQTYVVGCSTWSCEESTQCVFDEVYDLADSDCMDEGTSLCWSEFVITTPCFQVSPQDWYVAGKMKYKCELQP